MDYSYIGKNIRLLRKSKNLTTTGLKELSGISQGNISEIERGIKLPSCNAIIALQKAFGCSYDWLLSDHSPYDDNSKTIQTAIQTDIEKDNFLKCENYLDTECIRLFHKLSESDQIDLLSHMDALVYKNRIVKHLETRQPEISSPSIEKNDAAGTA